MFTVIKNAFSKLPVRFNSESPSELTTYVQADDCFTPEISITRVNSPSDHLGDVDLQGIATDVVALYNLAPLLSQTAERMDDHAREQAETVGDISRKTEEITRKLDSVIEQLETSAREAFSSLKLITEITQTTKILAINASIEAARAGAAGRPFEVVASEMRRLANQTEDTSQHMSRILHNMQVKVDDVIEVVGKKNETNSSNNAPENASSVTAITGAFHEINDRSNMQKEEAHQVHEMSGTAKSLSERLVLEVGKLRFGIHKKCEAAMADLMDHPDISSGSRALIESQLIQAMRDYSFFDLLYVTNKSGLQITRNIGHDGANPHSGKDAVGKDWSQRPWFIGAMNEEGLFTSDLYMSVATNQFCFTVSKTILNPDTGEVVGVFGADVNFERLLQH